MRSPAQRQAESTAAASVGVDVDADEWGQGGLSPPTTVDIVSSSGEFSDNQDSRIAQTIVYVM